MTADEEGDEVQALVWVCPLCDGAVIDELQLAEAREHGRAEQAAAEALEQHIAEHVHQMLTAAERRCSFVGAQGVQCTLPPHHPSVLHCPGRLLDSLLPAGQNAHAERCGCRHLGH